MKIGAQTKIADALLVKCHFRRPSRLNYLIKHEVCDDNAGQLSVYNIATARSLQTPQTGVTMEGSL